MEHPIRSEIVDGTAHVAVFGEIDYSNADDLADGFRGALASWSLTELFGMSQEETAPGLSRATGS